MICRVLSKASLCLMSLCALLLLASCAHYPDVRPSADGIHWVEVKAEDPESGARNALSQANDYCDSMEKKAAIVSEDQNYKGDMDESDYKTLKKAGKAAQTVGGAVWTFGGKKESEVGGLVGLGGAVANQVAGEGYKVKLKFKCL